MNKFHGLSVRGDHFDVGQALGQASRDAFRDVVSRIERFRSLERDWLGSDRVAALLGAAREAYPQYVREIEGIADGAQASFERVFLWNCRGDLPGGGDQTRPTSLGCTSVMIPGLAGPGGRVGAGEAGIVGHNEDDQYELDGHCCFVDVSLDDGGGFLSFYSPGLLPGHTFAVSRLGLVQTINHIRPHDQCAGVPRHLSARAVLDCTSLDEAVTRLRSTARASGFHHNLAMAGDSRMLSVEAPATGLAVREVDGASVHANHLLRPELALVEQTVAPSSAARQRRAEALLRASCSDPRRPLDVLGDTSDTELPIYRKARGSRDPGYTLATALFIVSSREVRYAIHADQDRSPEHAGVVAIRGLD